MSKIRNTNIEGEVSIVSIAYTIFQCYDKIISTRTAIGTRRNGADRPNDYVTIDLYKWLRWHRARVAV